MQRALGADWERLPPALRAHHGPERAIDRGHLDIHDPQGLHPLLCVLARLGALVSRRGCRVETTVARWMEGERRHWHRTMTFPDGQVLRFDSVWVPSGPGRFIAPVDPRLGLEMQVALVGPRLHYRGLRFVVRFGRRRLSVPQWLGPGVTRIVEAAVDERHFDMDFRMTHPWFGRLFRYAGRFEARSRAP